MFIFFIHDFWVTFFVSLYVVLPMFQLVFVWNNFRQFLLNVKYKNLHPMIILYVYSIICLFNYVSIKMKGCLTVLFYYFLFAFVVFFAIN
jgi:hypothetical protein